MFDHPEPSPLAKRALELSIRIPNYIADAMGSRAAFLNVGECSRSGRLPLAKDRLEAHENLDIGAAASFVQLNPRVPILFVLIRKGRQPIGHLFWASGSKKCNRLSQERRGLATLWDLSRKSVRQTSRVAHQECLDDVTRRQSQPAGGLLECSTCFA
jgi:hypothetical protein